MGVKNYDGPLCYVLGLDKDIRKKPESIRKIPSGKDRVINYVEMSKMQSRV